MKDFCERFSRFQKVTNGKCISVNLFFRELASIEASLKVIRATPTYSDSLNDFDNTIARKISSYHGRKIIMCGGGIDSTYLLIQSIACGIKADAISAVTRDNHEGLLLIDEICKKNGLHHHKVEANDLELCKSLDEFYSLKKRLPNDPIAPLVHVISKHALNLGYHTCIDGQFADTVFYANPQNRLLAFAKTIPRIFPPSKFSNEIHKQDRLSQLIYFFRLSLAQKVLYLARVEITLEAERATAALLNTNKAQDVLQVIFWHVLLKYRERDKYVLTSDFIKSPFDDLTYLQNFSKLPPATAKEHLRRSIQAQYPSAKKKLHSASFRQ